MPEHVPTSSTPSADQEPTAMPPTLRTAVWVLLAEAAVLAVVTAFLVYQDFSADDPRNGLLVTAYAAIMAIVCAGLGMALRRRRAWARGPAIVLQLLLVPISYYMITGGIPLIGVPVLVVGLVGAGSLLAPATRVALGLPVVRN